MIQTITKSISSIFSQPSQKNVSILSKLVLNQTRLMSKYLPKSAAKRLPLSTKHARKGFYKGKGATKQGTFRGKAGRFVVEKERLLELIVPDLTGFQLKPYIARTVPKWAPEEARVR
jgi:large subunit ribosomal protein L41